MVMLRPILFCTIALTTINNSSSSDEANIPNHSSFNIHINSSDLVIDRVKMTATFTGTVLLCMNNIKVLGQKAIFYFENESIQNIQRIELEGSIKAMEEDGSIALANNASFEMDKSELILSGNVMIDKKDKILKADEVKYRGKMNNIMLEK